MYPQAWLLSKNMTPLLRFRVFFLPIRSWQVFQPIDLLQHLNLKSYLNESEDNLKSCLFSSIPSIVNKLLTYSQLTSSVPITSFVSLDNPLIFRQKKKFLCIDEINNWPISSSLFLLLQYLKKSVCLNWMYPKRPCLVLRVSPQYSHWNLFSKVCSDNLGIFIISLMGTGTQQHSILKHKRMLTTLCIFLFPMLLWSIFTIFSVKLWTVRGGL